MHLEKFSFGTLQIDGRTYEQDVVIEQGEIRKRKKTPSKKFRDKFGHTPLSIAEKIPWKCQRLVIGTGAYGRLPVMKEVKREAQRRRVELVIVPTSEALRLIGRDSEANAILHVTCFRARRDTLRQCSRPARVGPAAEAELRAVESCRRSGEVADQLPPCALQPPSTGEEEHA